MDLLTPVDPEQAIIDELSTSYAIGTSIPEPKPDVFLRVVSVGGIQRDLVTDSFTIVLEAFAFRETDAHDALADALAKLQLAARNGRIGTATCYGLDVVALPQNYPLPSVPSHKRYLITITPAFRRRVTTL